MCEVECVDHNIICPLLLLLAPFIRRSLVFLGPASQFSLGRMDERAQAGPLLQRLLLASAWSLIVFLLSLLLPKTPLFRFELLFPRVQHLCWAGLATAIPFSSPLQPSCCCCCCYCSLTDSYLVEEGESQRERERDAAGL